MSVTDTGDQLPMSPKTPMLNFLKDYDMYRTPGQILSLRSSLAFVSRIVVKQYCTRLFSLIPVVGGLQGLPVLIFCLGHASFCQMLWLSWD